MSPISEKTQERLWMWLTSHGPFFFLLMALGAVMVFEAQEDRKQRTELTEHLREIDANRLIVISETMARVAESCNPHGDVGPR